MNKVFDKDLHSRYDNFGREIAKNFLKKEVGLIATDNPDIYGVDLILHDYEGNKVGYAEVEVRNSWKGLTFPFQDVNIPHRKRKLLENDLPTIFISVNNDGTALLFCGAKRVLSSDVQESYNKYVKKGEYFFKIPLDKMCYYKVR